ncbi:MAG: diguanylate cyclase [Polyangiales bacterium]
MADSKPPPSDDVPPPTMRADALADRLSFPGEVPPSSGGKFTRTVVTTSASFEGTASTAPKVPHLTMIAGPHIGATVKVSTGETTLGRAPECTYRIDSDGVSWMHARMFRVGAMYMLEDLKSTNGTGVNERRIEMSPLHDGDRIHLGPGVILRFNLWDELEAGVQVSLYESAVKDPLTKAFNRKHFNDRITQEIAFSKRHGTPLTLIIFDVDFFKKVNDTYGHPGGDAVLRTISAAMLATIRAEDVFARIGGEEFVLLARGVDARGAVAFAERVRAGVQALAIPFEQHTIPVTASFGVAMLDELPTGDGDALLALADRRLYEAKAGGRNRVVGPPPG